MSLHQQPVRVLVIDDSRVVQRTLAAILEIDPQIKVIGFASDPYEAAGIMRQEAPDVITLDVEMPRMDGLTFLRKLMSQHPIPVVMCSSLTESGSKTALEALDLGAVEVFSKPKGINAASYLEEISIQFCDAVKAAARAKLPRSGVAAAQPAAKPAPKQRAASAKKPKTPIAQPKLNADSVIPPKPASRCRVRPNQKRAIFIGASTGGTEALKSVLMGMPADSPPIFVVQHMPEQFTGPFAQRMDSQCTIHVKEAQERDIVTNGMAVIAPGNKHLLANYIGDEYRVELRDGPLVSRHRPSVDVLFRSAAQLAGSVAVGVILTGMGDDGATGMREMHDVQAQTIAQNEASCVVFGMPKEAIAAGGVDHVLHLSKIPAQILQLSGYHNA
uniref:Protein-glutamate methylesterase/protein-glutamine glutaminase n=1 Tax=Magnetococcus massalia (strain MO-1) TaxID=451514 RepID=A0A1S7LJK0_MAGMO|nr:Chemotaxis Response Regulator protein-glutamate methylesterase [Candidatus Magnetococcus massalia]